MPSRPRTSPSAVLKHLCAVERDNRDLEDRDFNARTFFQEAILPLSKHLGYAPHELFLEYNIYWHDKLYRVDAAVAARRGDRPWLLFSTIPLGSPTVMSRQLHLMEGLAGASGARGVIVLQPHLLSVATERHEWHCRLEIINIGVARELIRQCGRPAMKRQLTEPRRPRFHLVTESPSGQFTIDRDQLEQRLDTACAAKSNDDKKTTFESLALFLFDAIECVEIRKQNLLTDTGELDIVGRFTNPSAKPAFWNTADPYFVVECKNWRTTVTSREVEVFVGKLQKCRARFGILFSRNGVTGRSGRDAVGNIDAAWRQHGIVLIVVSEDIIRQVIRGWDFYTILEQLVEAARFSQKGTVDLDSAWR